ncbi:MAG: hypothetical protein ACFE9L_20915 [Candidatus Hodarchaeota archaeon]
MKIEKFAQTYLDFKDPSVLEVYQGYLIAGEVDKKKRCFWVNKQNIEGLAEVAKILAIDSGFSAILSFIPGGSFAYRLIKDQIGYPPRYNIIFEPEFYDITYSLVTLDKKGQPKGTVDGLVQSIDHIAKTVLKTGSKVQDAIVDFITKGKSKSKDKIPQSEYEEILGFTYLRFEDKTSIIRNRIVKERLKETKSTASRIAKSATAGLTPSIVTSFKTTANDEAVDFLAYLQKLGFNVKFSQALLDQ